MSEHLDVACKLMRMANDELTKAYYELDDPEIMKFMNELSVIRHHIGKFSLKIK